MNTSRKRRKGVFSSIFKLAEKGELTTTREIHQAYDEQVGPSCSRNHDLSTFRAAWLAKITSPFTASKADIQAQEAF